MVEYGRFKKGARIGSLYILCNCGVNGDEFRFISKCLEKNIRKLIRFAKLLVMDKFTWNVV